MKLLCFFRYAGLPIIKFRFNPPLANLLLHIFLTKRKVKTIPRCISANRLARNNISVDSPMFSGTNLSTVPSTTPSDCDRKSEIQDDGSQNARSRISVYTRDSNKDVYGNTHVFIIGPYGWTKENSVRLKGWMENQRWRPLLGKLNYNSACTR